MKIALITTCQHPCSPTTGWGAERYCWDIVECLDKEGHEVTIFGTEDSQIPENGRLIVCKNENIILPQYSYLFDYFDIFHDFSATKQVHDYCQNVGMKSLANQFNTHFLYPIVHKNIVCVSESQKQLGLAGKSGFEDTPWEKQVGYTGHLNEDAKVIYLGINLDLYKPKYEKEDYILYFNSWDYRKGIHIVIELARIMGFKLILAGATQHPEHQQTFNTLKSLIHSIPNISYEINVSNERKIELMRNAKALLFPSLFHQPFAVVVVESLACGTPIITTNMGAMSEIIQHGKTGFLCSNMDELLKGIDNIKTIDNKECRLDMEKRFDRNIMTKGYIKLYNKICENDEKCIN